MLPPLHPNCGCTAFPNYSVYFKPAATEAIAALPLLFPNYSVYFKPVLKSSKDIVGLDRFPNYSVYFKQRDDSCYPNL